jgi:hypothetical protein
MMNTAGDYSALFEAFRDARSAYVRLTEKGHGRSDRDLARDPDYIQLYRSGVQIAVIGGQAAIAGAIDSLCETDIAPRDATRAELQRFWSGMGTWQQAAGQRLM